MASRPDKFPEWATSDIVDPSSGQNNVIEPTSGKKTTGWLRNEIPPRQFFNWLARKTNQWLEYLDDQRSILDTRMTNYENNYSTLQSQITSNDSDISSLQSTVSTNVSDISNINSQLILANDSNQGFVSYKNYIAISLAITGGTYTFQISRIDNIVIVSGKFVTTSSAPFSAVAPAATIPTWARPLEDYFGIGEIDTGGTVGISEIVIQTDGGTRLTNNNASFVLITLENSTEYTFNVCYHVA